jgi:hypothetical protein
MFINRNCVYWAKVTQQLTLSRRYSQLVANRCCRLACSLLETPFVTPRHFCSENVFVNRFVRDERRSWTEVPLYHVIYSVWYYLRFHVIAVSLGTYYPWIRRDYCTCIIFLHGCITFHTLLYEYFINEISSFLGVLNYMFNLSSQSLKMASRSRNM